METTNTLPALTGSDKQIAWASAIRDGALADLAAIIEFGNALQTPHADTIRQENSVAERFLMEVYTGAAASEARWWIDNRQNPIQFAGHLMSATKRGYDYRALNLPRMVDTIRTIRDARARGLTIQQLVARS